MKGQIIYENIDASIQDMFLNYSTRGEKEFIFVDDAVTRTMAVKMANYIRSTYKQLKVEINFPTEEFIYDAKERRITDWRKIIMTPERVEPCYFHVSLK